MAKVQAHEGGFLVNKTFYYGAEVITSKNIQLITTKGEAMRYGTTANNIVEFPGEYDLDGENIRCWEANGKLSFVVRSKKGSIAFISNKEVLDVGSFDDIDTFLCAEQGIIDEIERMEMEGDVALFDAPDVAAAEKIESEEEA